MKILKVNIVKGIKKIRILYKQFDEQVEKFGLEEIIEEWNNVFEAIDFDYEEANNDFIKAIYIATTKNKFPPTIYEIVDEMREIYKERAKYEYNQALKEVLRLSELFLLKTVMNADKSIEKYKILSRKYTSTEIENMVKANIQRNDELMYTLDICFEELMQNEQSTTN